MGCSLKVGTRNVQSSQGMLDLSDARHSGAPEWSLPPIHQLAVSVWTVLVESACCLWIRCVGDHSLLSVTEASVGSTR